MSISFVNEVLSCRSILSCIPLNMVPFYFYKKKYLQNHFPLLFHTLIIQKNQYALLVSCYTHLTWIPIQFTIQSIRNQNTTHSPTEPWYRFIWHFGGIYLLLNEDARRGDFSKSYFQESKQLLIIYWVYIFIHYLVTQYMRFFYLVRISWFKL